MKSWPAILIATLITSCTSVPVRWHQEGTSETHRQTDTAACHASARTEADREDAIRHRPSTETIDALNTYQSNMAVYEYRKNRDTLFARCMTDKGYRPN